MGGFTITDYISVDSNIIFCIIAAWVIDTVLGGLLAPINPVRLLSFLVKHSKKRFIALLQSISDKNPDKAEFYESAAGCLHAAYVITLVFVSLAVALDLARRLHESLYYALTIFFLFSSLSARRIAGMALEAANTIKRGSLPEAGAIAHKMTGIAGGDSYVSGGSVGGSAGDGFGRGGSDGDSAGGGSPGQQFMSAFSKETIIRVVVGSVSRGSIDHVISPMLFITAGALLGIPVPFVYALMASYPLASSSARDHGHSMRFDMVGKTLSNALAFIPARLSLVLLPLSSLLSGHGFLTCFRIMRRDHGNNINPRGVWGESAFAGALKIQLGGHTFHSSGSSFSSSRSSFSSGGATKIPLIGDDSKAPEASDIGEAVKIMMTASIVTVALALAILFQFNY